MTDIRLAASGDVPAIAGLLADVDRFYGDPVEVDAIARAEQVTRLLFRPVPVACVLLAWDGPAAVGLAAYSFLWPAVGATPSLYLKELYVVASRRGQGLGRLLMRRLRDIAEAEGCSRLEWTADQDNHAARAFYTRLGIEPTATKLFYRQVLGGDEERRRRPGRDRDRPLKEPRP